MPASNSLLAAHLRKKRIAHTYLFSGPEGPAKKELALDFAKALNCAEGNIFEECRCVSCQKIEKGNHIDVRIFGEDEKSRSIKIEEVRTILHEASLKPFEGTWKVFILEGADRLTLEASNALLKTLEEPPAHSVFILLVENKAHVLETIQSRACEIRVFQPSSEGWQENERISLLEKRGWKAFFDSLKDLSRPELQEELEALMFYLRTEGISESQKEGEKLERYLKALDSVYEVKEAVEANVNQKLALTQLEIQLGNALDV